jgi:hypothetical protein
MIIGVVPGIKLSRASKQAWEESGADFVYPRSTFRPASIESHQLDVVVNLGSRAYPWLDAAETTDLKVFNPPRVVRLSSDRALFESIMGGLTPEDRNEGLREVWIKGAGRGGANKFRMELDGAIVSLPRGYAVQRHVEGEEWRIHTVNRLVVQSHLRHGENGDRSYEWVGVNSTPTFLRDLVKTGVDRIASAETNTVLAWDVITDGNNAFILEANTCPGMNVATATRIVNQIRRSE